MTGFLLIGFFALVCAFLAGWTLARSRKVVATENAVLAAVVQIEKRVRCLENERGQA